MGFDDRACDRKAEAAAAAIARAAVIEAVEAFEDLLELVGRDARPAIADGDLESAVAGASRLPASTMTNPFL